MRKQLTTTGKAGDTTLVTQAAPEKGKGKGKKKATTAPELMDESKVTVAKIIEEKPKNRVVLEYIQDRCNDLTRAKMA